LEIFLRIILFLFCLLISCLCFDFKPVSVAFFLGLYNFGTSLYELHKRKSLVKSHIEEANRLNNEKRDIFKSEKKKHISSYKTIIKDNNKTINQIVTLINSIYSSVELDQKKNLLQCLANEIDQQITYTKYLCDLYFVESKFQENLKPLTDFKYSIVKQLQGKTPIKGIDFEKLLEQLMNLEDKINV